MQLRQLAYLDALAREKHFGRAAAACNVSQPTLSAAIRALEEEMGSPIVERGHAFRGLTTEGEAVLSHARRILAECEAMTQTLEEMGQGISGQLRIGVIPTALPVVSHITAPFYQRYPRVTVTVLSLTSDQIARGIADFSLEAGLTYLDNEPLEHVRAKPIYREDYAFLTPARGPHARRRSISWAEAAQVPLCLLTPDMQNRRIIDGIFRSVGQAPEPAMETNSIFNLCAHAAMGHWSSIVPKPLLEFFGVPKGTKPVPLVDPAASRSVGLVIADREPAPPLVRNIFAMTAPLDLRSLLSPPEPLAKT